MEGRLRSMSRFLIHDIIQQCDARPRETKRKFGESCLLLQFVVFTVVLENFNEVWKQRTREVSNLCHKSRKAGLRFDEYQEIVEPAGEHTKIWRNSHLSLDIQRDDPNLSTSKVCGSPIVGTSNSTNNFGYWIRSGNCIVWLGIVSHKDCHVKAFSCSYLELRCENFKRSK